MTQGESAFKRQIKDLLNKRKVFWTPVQQGGVGSKPGVPDIIACYRGRFIGIEAKVPGGRQRFEQKDRQREIEAAGGIYLLAYDLETVSEALDDIERNENVSEA